MAPEEDSASKAPDKKYNSNSNKTSPTKSDNSSKVRYLNVVFFLVCMCMCGEKSINGGWFCFRCVCVIRQFDPMTLQLQESGKIEMMNFFPLALQSRGRIWIYCNEKNRSSMMVVNVVC